MVRLASQYARAKGENLYSTEGCEQLLDNCKHELLYDGSNAECAPGLPSVNTFAGLAATSLLSLGQELILKGLLAQGMGGVKE